MTKVLQVYFFQRQMADTQKLGLGQLRKVYDHGSCIYASLQ